MSLLPQSKSEINQSLLQQIILLYGRPKIGKSTFCSFFPSGLFIQTEPGLAHLSVNKVAIRSWNEFLEVGAEIANGKHSFGPIIIDTVDQLITFANDHICTENHIEYIGDMPHGRGWAIVTEMIKQKLTKLASLGYGLIMVSHCDQVEIETKVKKFNRWTVNLGGKNREFILAFPELILFMDSEMRGSEEIGIVRTKPSLFWEAGDKSKLLPESIEFPLSKPEVAYNKIVESFNKKGVGNV
jgi:hypothetical protein